MKTELTSLSRVGILYTLLLILIVGCKKEIPEKHGKTFVIVYYDSFDHKPVQNISVILERTVCELPPLFCDTYFLDTLMTDSLGRISFTLGPEELEKIHEFSIAPLSVPEIFIGSRYVQGKEFEQFEKGRTINVIPACFLELREIDIFPMGSKSCDFYFLDVKFQTYYSNIINWTSGMPVRSSKQYHKFRPGLNDTFRARFGCANYRDTQIRVISSHPYDTIVMSDYFHP